MQDITSNQSVRLLQELHILTREGKLNQDSRRKLKQVHHLFNFIKPLLEDLSQHNKPYSLVDHGAGKSYLGFILYDLFLKSDELAHVYGIETRAELVEKSKNLAKECEFNRMEFLNLSVLDSITSKQIPETVEIVTALHACNTATDDAIDFALSKKAQYIVIVPCCQAEVASVLKKNKPNFQKDSLAEIWRHPLHTREFGSHLTNVLRCLRLEASGYQVTATEFVGLEHSMKNEIIIAKKNTDVNVKKAQINLKEILERMGLSELINRFSFE